MATKLGVLDAQGRCFGEVRFDLRFLQCRDSTEVERAKF